MKKLLLTFLLAVGFLGLFPIIGLAATYDTAVSAYYNSLPKFNTAFVAFETAKSQLIEDQVALTAVKAANPIVIPVKDQAAVDTAFTAVQTAQITVSKDKILADESSAAIPAYLANQDTYQNAANSLATARENLMEASHLNDATYAARSNSYNPFTADALAKAQTAYDAAFVAFQAAGATAAKGAIAADAAFVDVDNYLVDEGVYSNAEDYYLTTVKNVNETYEDAKNSAANTAAIDAIDKVQIVYDAELANLGKANDGVQGAYRVVKSTAEAARAAIDSSGTASGTAVPLQNANTAVQPVAAPVKGTYTAPSGDSLVKCGVTNGKVLSPEDAKALVESCNLVALFDMINAIINWLIMISMPLAAIAFAYAGWLYLSAGDNTGQVTKAKEVFLNVGIGVIVILAGWLVFKLIETTFLNTGNGYATYLTK